MLSFFRRTLGRRSARRHAERERLREAQRAATHIPAAGEARAVLTCRVALLDGTDVSVELPVGPDTGGGKEAPASRAAAKRKHQKAQKGIKRHKKVMGEQRWEPSCSNGLPGEAGG